MKILTLNNRSFDLNELPEEVDEDTRFSVLDNSNPQEPDFFFMPLIGMWARPGSLAFDQYQRTGVRCVGV